MLLGRRVKDDHLPDWILARKQAAPDHAHVPGRTPSPATLPQFSLGRDPCTGLPVMPFRCVLVEDGVAGIGIDPSASL
ncbi:hypothetical protein D9M69_201860 [compost metagenome]